MSPEIIQRTKEYAQNTIRPNIAKAVKVGTAVLLVGSVVVFSIDHLRSNNSKAPTELTAKDKFDSKAYCDNFQSTDSSQSQANYTYDAFFPKPKIGVHNDATAKEYVDQLFGNGGPLGGPKGDLKSLAAIESLLVVPAEEGVIKQSHYDYDGMYSQDLSTFRNAEKQGLTSPKNSPVIKACKDAFTLMVQVQSYNSDWNSAGTERIVEFAAKRNLANWNITSMNEDEPIVYGKMQGVTLDFYTDIKGIETKDFQSIFIGTGKDIEGVAFANGPGPITQPKTSNKVQKKTGHGGSTTTTTGPGPGKPKGGGSTTTTTGPGPGKPKGGSPTTTTTIKTPTTTTTYEIPTTTTTFIYAPTTTTTVAPTTTTTEELKGIEPVCVPDPPYVICTTGSNTSGNN